MRRWLGFGKDEWDALPWDLQQAYLDGLSNEEELPFRIEADAGTVFQPDAAAATGTEGPTVRTGVNTGAPVLDLRAMIAGLEATPNARRRQ